MRPCVPFRPIHFLALAIAGEAGELANLVKKKWQGGDVVDDQSMRQELADSRIPRSPLDWAFNPLHLLEASHGRTFTKRLHGRLSNCLKRVLRSSESTNQVRLSFSGSSLIASYAK
jgi:hypothetical protein